MTSLSDAFASLNQTRKVSWDLESNSHQQPLTMTNQPSRILVVDDDVSIISLMTSLLEDQKFSVFSAGNGLEGMNVLKAHHVDLVITDMLMPEMGGVEFVQKMKTVHPKPKIIAMSGGDGIGQIDYLGAALQCGANQTFEKPFEFSQMLSSIKNLLDQ